MQIFSNLSYFIVKLNHPFNWWQYYVYKLELICSSAFSSVSSFHLTRFFLIIQLSRFLYLNCDTWLSFYFQYIWPDSISDKNRLVLTFDSWPYSFDTPNLFLTFGTDFFFYTPDQVLTFCTHDIVHLTQFLLLVLLRQLLQLHTQFLLLQHDVVQSLPVFLRL